MPDLSKIELAKEIANRPGFGTGAHFRDLCAAENEALDNLPDPEAMAPVMASTDPVSHWHICSFGNSGADEEKRDWYLVSDRQDPSYLGDVEFPSDAMCDAIAIAALCNAWRMGLLVRKDA